MSIISAWREGVRRVVSAPAVPLGLLLVTLALALPAGLALRQALAEHLGSSLAAAEAAQGVNTWWWQEFSEQARGLGESFTPAIIGFAAVLDNTSAILDGRPRPLAVWALAAAYIVLWLFLSGGILDRYARDRATRAPGFFSACGRIFFRFLRLWVVAALVYGLIFVVVSPLLFGSLYGWATRDLTVEREAFAIRLALYAVLGVLLLGVNLIFDYAKVRAVVEDRRSMVGALLAAVRFVGRHAGASAGLYALNAALFLVVLAVYALVAPGTRGGWATWLGVAVVQLYVLARLSVRLVFLASATVLFQQRLAHAAYAAPLQPAWPESPAAEAMGPAPKPEAGGADA